MEPDPVLDAETQALIAQLVADSYDYFANSTLNIVWNPDLGPSQIGVSYHDYEEPLSSYKRELLEYPNAAEINEGWTAPHTPILKPMGAILSPQSRLDLPFSEPWDPDAETSEEFKQGKIMAAQHKEVMEETEMNGLCMPSPAPEAGEGRIAAVAKSRHAAALEPQPSRFSPLAAAFVPSSRSPERRGRNRGRGSFRSHSASRGSNRGGALLNAYQPRMPIVDHFFLPGARSDDRSGSRGRSHGRCREGRFRGRPTGGTGHFSSGSCLDRIYGLHGLQPGRFTNCSNPSDVDNERDRSCSSATPYSPPRIARDRDQRLAEHDERLEAKLHTNLSPESRRLFEYLDAEEEEDDEEENDQLTHRPTRQGKGKGKEREHSRSPTPEDLPIPRGPHHDPEGYKHHHRSVAHRINDLDLASTYDPKPGESIDYIPWPHRDPEQDRISDSKVTEIHLGETSDDECEIRELFGKMCIEDLDFESIMANRRSVEEQAMDTLMAPYRGFHMGDEWRAHLGENERVVSGDVLRGRGVMMERW